MYLYEVDKGVPGTELLKRFPQYSCRSIYRHASKPFDCNEDDKKNIIEVIHLNSTVEIKEPSNAKFKELEKKCQCRTKTFF